MPTIGPNLARSLKGKTIGRLTVISDPYIKVVTKRDGSQVRVTFYLCSCECGKKTEKRQSDLAVGGTKGCGCLMPKHGATGANRTEKQKHIYNSWNAMKARCFNVNHWQFKDWGGRGITVCEEWLNSFAAFYRDVEATWAPGLSIDRYPNKDGNYEPGNVRWATRKEQQNHRRDYKKRELCRP
jgi:hypothetical protein